MFNVLIFIIGAGIMFYMGLHSVLQRRRLQQKGQRVEARVAGTVQSRDGTAYLLEFETEGGSHRLHYPKAAKGKGFASGETVTLYYDPEDPEKMYVEGDRSVLGAEILYFCLAVVLLALMVSFSRGEEVTAMVLEHVGMPQPGDRRVVFSASAEELEAAIQAEQAAENPPQAEEDLLTAAVNRAILTSFSTLYQELVEKEHLVPVTDPDFELLAVNRAEGFRAGAEFYCLPPLKLERYTGFTQPIQPRPIRQVSIELEVNTRHGDEDRAADAAGKAALRQQVARELYAQRCAQAKALARRELIFQLGGCVKGPLPKDLVSGNYFAEQRNFNLRLQANNVNFDQYLKVRGQTVEQFRTELHAQAEQKLRGSLGLLMVAEREHLWPTDAEVEAALAHWKGERTFPANDFRKVRQGIASQRAAEFVEAHSTLLPPPEEPVLETIA